MLVRQCQILDYLFLSSSDQYTGFVFCSLYLCFMLILGICILLCYFHDKTQFYIKFNLFYFINGLQFHINPKELENEDLAFLYHIEACTSFGDLSLPLVQEFQKHLLKTFFNGHYVHNESASHQQSRNRKINCITVTAIYGSIRQFF